MCAYLQTRDMQAGRDLGGAKSTHRSYSTGEEKRIDYIFVSSNINTTKFETMENMAGRSAFKTKSE